LNLFVWQKDSQRVGQDVKVDLGQELIAVGASNGSFEGEADEVGQVFGASVQDERKENPEKVGLQLSGIRATDKEVTGESCRAVQAMFERLDVTLEQVQSKLTYSYNYP